MRVDQIRDYLTIFALSLFQLVWIWLAVPSRAWARIYDYEKSLWMFLMSCNNSFRDLKVYINHGTITRRLRVAATYGATAVRQMLLAPDKWEYWLRIGCKGIALTQIMSKTRWWWCCSGKRDGLAVTEIICLEYLKSCTNIFDFQNLFWD